MENEHCIIKNQADKTVRNKITGLISSILRHLDEMLGIVGQVLIFQQVRFVGWTRITLANLGPCGSRQRCYKAVI